MDFIIYQGCDECDSKGWIWKRDNKEMTVSRVQCPRCLSTIQSVKEFEELKFSWRQICLACEGKGSFTYKVEGTNKTVNLPCECCGGRGEFIYR